MEKAVEKLKELRMEIGYQYYEISQPMEATTIMKRLDKIIKLLSPNTKE